jgi:hypothetical protein
MLTLIPSARSSGLYALLEQRRSKNASKSACSLNANSDIKPTHNDRSS